MGIVQCKDIDQTTLFTALDEYCTNGFSLHIIYQHRASIEYPMYKETLNRSKIIIDCKHKIINAC